MGEGVTAALKLHEDERTVGVVGGSVLGAAVSGSRRVSGRVVGIGRAGVGLGRGLMQAWAGAVGVVGLARLRSWARGAQVVSVSGGASAPGHAK